MRKITMVVAGSIMAATGTVAAVVPASAHAATAPASASPRVLRPASPPTDPPCPSGDACEDLIENDGLTYSIENKWYYYGCYQLYNDYGDRELYNHQTGGAMMRTYASSNCTGSPLNTVAPGHAGEYNITPVNSILVSPS